MQALLKNTDVPYRLFRSAIELLSTSITDYIEKNSRPKNLKYYPAIILTFWSGFETLVRLLIEKLVRTTSGMPSVIVDFLLEAENQVDRSGVVSQRVRHRPVLDRYSVFLKYAYDLHINHGLTPWQNLVRAQELRDYYTHLKVNVPKSTKLSEVLLLMESVLAGLIWPSCLIKKTIYLEQYELYFLWSVLYKISLKCQDFVEEPFQKSFAESWEMFHCNFNNVDVKKYPNSAEQLAQLRHAKKTPHNKSLNATPKLRVKRSPTSFKP